MIRCRAKSGRTKISGQKLVRSANYGPAAQKIISPESSERGPYISYTDSSRTIFCDMISTPRTALVITFSPPKVSIVPLQNINPPSHSTVKLIGSLIVVTLTRTR